MDFICLDRRFWSKCYKHCHWPYFDESTICRLITEISTLVNKKFKMCPRWGLNSRPSDYETDALPTALLRPSVQNYHSHLFYSNTTIWLLWCTVGKRADFVANFINWFLYAFYFYQRWWYAFLIWLDGIFVTILLFLGLKSVFVLQNTSLWS